MAQAWKDAPREISKLLLKTNKLSLEDFWSICVREEKAAKAAASIRDPTYIVKLSLKLLKFRLPSGNDLCFKAQHLASGCNIKGDHEENATKAAATTIH